jgi:hypothetical protein
VDQFGDGWTGNVNFSYWGQIRSDDTNVIMESLDCNCAKMMGCIHPMDLNIDQLFHFTVTAEDANGNEYIPDFAWEIHWTAQIVEDGVFKEKYYGGLSTSMTFEYSRILETYELVFGDKLWEAPQECSSDCHDMTAGPADYLSDVVYVDGVSTGTTMTEGAVANDYYKTSWFITEVGDNVNLVTYGNPWCNATADATTCKMCLPDGDYIYRATGACDPDGDIVEWDFCGVTGNTQDQLNFQIISGKCYPGTFGGACGVSTRFPTRSPTHAPSTLPTVSPTGAPTNAPTSNPTTAPTFAPSSVPTSAPTRAPSSAPTSTPTSAPSRVPTSSPTFAPTAAPTFVPSSSPTRSPTLAPSGGPTPAPTTAPTAAPSTAPTRAPTNAPTFAPTGKPSVAPTPKPSVAPTPNPSSTPTLAPTPYGPPVITGGLGCSDNCTHHEIAVDETCLYVTLLDQFGDGWAEGSYFRHWMSVNNKDSNEVTFTLDCNCTKRVGCVRTADIPVDQQFHFAFENSLDANPEFFWEIFWTVQIVENGVWGNKYYGGYDTAMTFNYSVAHNNYSEPFLDKSWVFPEKCNTELVYNNNLTQQYIDGLYGSSADRKYSLGSGEYAGYLDASWYITDTAGHDVLYGYSLTACEAYGSKSSYTTCLADGEYIFRSTGACDPHAHNYTWKFCGMTGGAQEQLQFNVIKGQCSRVIAGSVQDYCDDKLIVPPAITGGLGCTTNCSANKKEVGRNDTCLYVTLMDQFGDGWAADSFFQYWVSSNGVPSNIISYNLDCNCSKMVGCFDSVEMSIDHQYHVSFNTGGNVPEYFWEVLWTVQVVENGVWKEKHYGGFDTSITFNYSVVTETYSDAILSKALVYPPPCESSMLASTAITVTDVYLNDIYGTSLANATYTSYPGDSRAYMEMQWFVTDAATKTDLYAYNLPFCDDIDVKVGNGACIPDGNYVFRATGACDTVYDNSTWAFCNRTGHAQEEFYFSIVDGDCLVGYYADVADVCMDILRVDDPVADDVLRMTRPVVGVNETGLLITIYDQFGDGWRSDVALSYHITILSGTHDSNVASAGLYSNGSMMSGMLHPNMIAFDQKLYLSLAAFTAGGMVLPAPEYYWEIHWTVQVYHNGEMGATYYGGYDTSMVFDYAFATEEYALSEWNNLWTYPEGCGEMCLALADNMAQTSVEYFEPFTSSGMLAHSDVASHSMMQSSDFLETGWYITDITNMTLLYAYGKPYCDAVYDAAGGVATTCKTCSADGEYIFRVTGANDPDAPMITWDFCNVSGDVQDEVRFTVTSGVCAVVSRSRRALGEIASADHLLESADRSAEMSVPEHAKSASAMVDSVHVPTGKTPAAAPSSSSKRLRPSALELIADKEIVSSDESNRRLSSTSAAVVGPYSSRISTLTVGALALAGVVLVVAAVVFGRARRANEMVGGNNLPL